MSLDLTALRLMRHRERCLRLNKHVPRAAVDQKTAIMLDDFLAYFREFPDVKVVEPDPFTLWFVGFRHPKLTDEAKSVFAALIKQTAVDVDPAIEQGFMERLAAASAVADLTTAIEKFHNGEEVDVLTVTRSIADEIEFTVDRKIKNPQVLDPIEDLLKDEENDTGFHWHLPGINRIMRPLRPGDFIIVAGRPDKGKCLSPETPVIMADGRTVRADAVRQGDYLAGVTGPRLVLGTTTGRAPMYRITYPWGESYTVNDEHVLSLKRSKAEGEHQTGDILNVPVREYVTWPEGRKGRYKGWKAALDLPEQDLPMDPYLFGLWLGDGSTHKAQITTVDPEILAAFTEAYGEPTAIFKGITYSFGYSGMWDDLVATGAHHNKHIPDVYLRSSREQRLQLLAGLIDSDGYAGDVYEIVTKSKGMSEQYVWLARSLGFHATSAPTFKRATNCDHAGDRYYRVKVGAEAYGVVPVRLERKRGNDKPRKRKGLHFGFTVEALPVGDYAGFELDGDHLFLLGDFTVTHNTTFCAHMLTHMAAQVDALFPGENRSVIWVNNEGPGKRIITRNFQAALNATVQEMVQLQHQPPKNPVYRSALREGYIEAIGGRGGTLRVFDVHDMWNHEVEDILRRYPPAVVLFDMVDNIRFGGDVNNNGQRTDQLLEAMYQWARLIAVKYDCACIATSQISADGDGLNYPTLGMLKDSKCFAPDTPVRMYDGSTRRIDSIKVGDQVMGIDGTARNVIGLGRGSERMYRVSGKGWHFDCNESHNLVVQNRGSVKVAGLLPNETGKVSLREFMAHPKYRASLKAVRCSIPYAETALPMDPYLFGLWLGDGAQRECRITSGDPEILAYLESLPTYRRTYKQKSNCSDVYFGPRKWLKDIGVWMNKHIPQIYKTASMDQRRALLAGLMDSDGTLDHGSAVISMSQKRKLLVDDIAEVAASLGYNVFTKSKACTASYSVTFAPTDSLPCLLLRKVHKCAHRAQSMNVEELGEGEYVGITVDKDHMYCGGNYIAFSNTGKQGAADAIITIGAVNDPLLENVRYIGTTKNKLRRAGAPGTLRLETIMQGDRARFVESD